MVSKQVELKVTVTMTNQQVRDYADEFGLSETNVAEDVRANMKLDLADATKSLFWTARIT